MGPLPSQKQVSHLVGVCVFLWRHLWLESDSWHVCSGRREERSEWAVLCPEGDRELVCTCFSIYPHVVWRLVWAQQGSVQPS